MDLTIIQAAQAGRRDAQATLLRLLQDHWFRLCLTLLGNIDQAREATQETALRFLRQLPTFAAHSQLKTWALGIAINVVREMRRHRHHPTDVTPPPRSPAPDPHAQAELAEQRVLLRSMLAHLPDRQREAVLLRYFEDLSVQDTAIAMNCAPGTVKATLHQALRSLRQSLSAPEKETGTGTVFASPGAPFSPSPGTPGEGQGEGVLIIPERTTP